MRPAVMGWESDIRLAALTRPRLGRNRSGGLQSATLEKQTGRRATNSDTFRPSFTDRSVLSSAAAFIVCDETGDLFRASNASNNRLSPRE